MSEYDSNALMDQVEVLIAQQAAHDHGSELSGLGDKDKGEKGSDFFRKHLRKLNAAESHFDSITSMIDPTAWMQGDQKRDRIKALRKLYEGAILMCEGIEEGAVPPNLQGGNP